MGMNKSAVARYRHLVFSVVISVGAGGLSALIVGGSARQYTSLALPVLAPPALAFPIVWTLLYILMGVSAQRIYTARHPDRGIALLLYGAQLVANMLWPAIFFLLKAHLFALIWLGVLWVLVVAMLLCFYRIDRTAALLQAPYLLWVAFAGYLNLGIYLLNG